MKKSQLIALFAASLFLSCSIKNQKEDININLGSNPDQKNQNIQIKNNYAKGLNKIKPSDQHEVQKADFLAYATAENFELLLKEQRASFVVFGMVWYDYSDFEKKYGIKVKTENCVIAPGIANRATINNQLIADYLRANYDDEWKSDLKILPFGIE